MEIIPTIPPQSMKKHQPEVKPWKQPSRPLFSLVQVQRNNKGPFIYWQVVAKLTSNNKQYYIWQHVTDIWSGWLNIGPKIAEKQKSNNCLNTFQKHLTSPSTLDLSSSLAQTCVQNASRPTWMKTCLFFATAGVESSNRNNWQPSDGSMWQAFADSASLFQSQ